MNFKITKQKLSLAEASAYITTVVDLSFDPDGNYLPIFSRVANQLVFLENYTDFVFKEDFEQNYSEFCDIDPLSVVLEHGIALTQYQNILESIKDEIENRKNKKNEMLSEFMSVISDKIKDLDLETLTPNLGAQSDEEDK